MIIEVTQEDIDGGRSTSSLCPIARALTRATGTPYRVTPYTYWPVGNPRVSHDNTRSMRRFIELFDNHDPVKPTRFRVKLP